MAIDFSLPARARGAAPARCASSSTRSCARSKSSIDESNRDALVVDRHQDAQGRAASGGCGCRTCRRSTAAWGSATSRWPRSRPRPAKSRFGPFALNAQAPDEGNMHTLLHWATDEQKENYLRPLCEGRMRSCFAMTEPEVAGSDPTLIQTRAVLDGDDWVINGHKWFISGARGAQFAILIARTEDAPEIPQAGNTAFLVDLPARGLGGRARRRDDVGQPQPLRDPHRRTCACRADEHARRARPGPPARPGAARPGAARALHALDRPGGDRARHDGRPRARSASRTARCSRRSRASSG